MMEGSCLRKTYPWELWIHEEYFKNILTGKNSRKSVMNTVELSENELWNICWNQVEYQFQREIRNFCTFAFIKQRLFTKIKIPKLQITQNVLPYENLILLNKILDFINYIF
jgi:hypothetical protein